MSGIVGIWNMDGEPIDRGLLGRMTGFMTFRGPDAQKIWIDSETGSVGFGHTLLKTTFEAEFESQPFTLDGKVWIVADARIDAQDDLIAQLNAKPGTVHPNIDSLTDPQGLLVGQASSLRPGLSPAKSRPEGRLQPQKADPTVKKGSVTDVELILRAYHLWDEDCVEHLLGDFAFAIWDGPKKKLFCARDQMGVKPFFYAHIGRTVIFSSSLDCVRQHPKVSDELNDLAIADFLLFGLNQDPATTSFADIQRIPPAHRAAWSRDGVSMTRYWTMPIDEPIYFKRADDYTDRFRELLDQSVSDRLRTNKLGVFMSGGLDSPTLAATACKIFRGRSPDGEVLAFTTVIPEVDQNEGYYAGLVAKHLGIPIHFQERRGEVIDPNWHASGVRTPEPVSDPTCLAGLREEYRTIAEHTRVVFYGEGPDNALQYEWKYYLSYLIRKRKFARLAFDVAGHVIRHRRAPLIPTIPRMIRERANSDRWVQAFPGWLAESFEDRLKLRSRWEAGRQYFPGTPSHPLHPWGYPSFFAPLWQALFGDLDPDATRMPLEVRHPFLDLRLLRYMLAVPAVPWCRVKYLVRRAMRGALPDEVLRRPKSPLTSDPGWVGGRRYGLPELNASQLRRYVDLERVPKEAGADMVAFRANFRPFALNCWLRNATTTRTTESIKEAFNDEFVTEEAR